LDYEWVYFEEYGKPFNFSEWVETLFKGYRSDYNELNDCIPLMKWYELLKSIPDIQNRQSWYRIYSDSIKELGRLEGAGVKVEEEKFIDRFSFSPKNIYEGRVYTKYNPYTTTGRPSNRHLNVNYSALNKSDGSRECFVSRFDGGTLLQFDYESYHIRLIAKIVGYEFPKGETAHQHLANLYGTDYETAKALTFKYLYGGLDSLAREIPFFQIVDKYIKEVYQKFVISGVLKTPLYGREIHFTKIEGGTEQKVFNYLLQALETEVNYKKMSDILNEMSGMKSKLILYTYDAFLIDVHPMERDEILKLLPTIMEKGGFPVRIDEGINYNNLVHLG
jgi:DNA polymerase I-like protein with 3'-5' exonuclease and polymerase domains